MKSGWIDLEYVVAPIKANEAKAFIKEHHYSHGCHNGPMTWGLYRKSDESLVGVIAFATPCSENVRASVFGPDKKHMVTELHRLAIIDPAPNLASWFIVRGLAGLQERKPDIRGVLSFADSTEGHLGTIYQATNALYCGMTSASATFYLDETGRLRHPRQNGQNITRADASKRGWVPVKRGGKYRYLYILGNKTERKALRKDLLLSPSEFPKGLSAAV